VLVALAGCSSRPEPHLRDEGYSVEELRTMLADSSPEVQARGAFGLSLHGPEASPAVPELVEALKRPDALARQNAALALGAIGPAAASAVPALTDLLGDSEWAVRRQAALALGEIGPAAKAALPALAKRDADANKQVREAAKAARRKIGGSRDAPAERVTLHPRERATLPQRRASSRQADVSRTGNGRLSRSRTRRAYAATLAVDRVLARQGARPRAPLPRRG
jgi:HEAT repeat protein